MTSPIDALADLPDGGFVLRPNRGMVRVRKRALGVSAVLGVGIYLVVVAQTLSHPQILWWPDRLLPLVGIAFVVILAWYILKPPALKADAMKVSVLDGLDTKRMSRSDLAFVFRGQITHQVRAGSYWDKSYIFAASDGTVWLSPRASGFTDDGIIEFAQRLKVPIRGDFTVQVNDRVDPAST